MAKSKANTTAPANTPDSETKPVYKMSAHLRKYRTNYKGYQRPGGSLSLDNADETALLLRALEPTRVKRVAEKLLDVDLSKYDKLNNGQIRMNSGNKIRNAIKRGDTTVAALKSAINAVS